ncbi:DNA polymerase III subunit beta [candidate division KSB1 bacterium]|nr:DNA polymerase III subunit beta [candidate division KSB1 bacterium]
MHFIVNKTVFLNALQKVIGVIPSKTSIPILSNILLELNENILRITGTDLEISISTEIMVQPVESGALTIPAKLIVDIVRELPDIPLEINSDEKDNITLKTEKGVYRLAGESRDEFPNIIVDENEGEVSFNSKQLSRMINKTIFAVTTDELRTTLMGVYFQIFEHELRLVATDGHRLSKIINQNFQSPGFEKSIILPTKSLSLLLKNFEDIPQKEGQDIKIIIGENHATFKWEGTSIYTKLIEGKYPKYESVIPLDNDLKLTVDKESLFSSTKRVSIFSNSITHQVRFIINANQMDVRSEDIEFGGEAVESIPVEFSGESFEIGYNAVYILDIIKNIDTKDVIFLLKSPKNAALIHPGEQLKGENLQMLLMPIRLTDD